MVKVVRVADHARRHEGMRVLEARLHVFLTAVVITPPVLTGWDEKTPQSKSGCFGSWSTP